MSNINLSENLEELINYVFIYIRHIELEDYGYKNKRITDLPNVFQKLILWEIEHLKKLSSKDKERFFIIKESVAKMIERFNVSTHEVWIKSNNVTTKLVA